MTSLGGQLKVRVASDSVGVHVVKLGDKLTEQVNTVKYLGALLVVIYI